jgi:hypothetical protein
MEASDLMAAIHARAMKHWVSPEEKSLDTLKSAYAQYQGHLNNKRALPVKPRQRMGNRCGQ